MHLPPPPGDVVVCVGEVVVDRVSRIPKKLRAGQQTAEHYVEKLGGCAVNAALGARFVSAYSRFIGHVGEGPIETALTNALSAAGVDLRLIRRGVGAHNDIMVGPWATSGPCSVFKPGDATSLEAADFSSDYLIGGGVLVLNSHHFYEPKTRAFAFAASDAAHAAGMAVLLDVSAVNRLLAHGARRFRRDLDRIEPHVVLCNEVEFDRLMAGGVFILRQSEALVVHRDRRSTLVFPPGGRSFEVPVEAVEPCRTVGAGDAFNGGFAAALCAGTEDLRDGVHSGHLAARAWVTSEALTATSHLVPGGLEKSLGDHLL